MSAAGLGGLKKPAPKNATAATPGAPTKEEAAAQDKAKEQKQKGDKQADYCSYIAVGTEAVGTAMQALSNKNVESMPTGSQTAQRDQLLKAAASYENRAQTAQIQTIGWGVTAGCYAALLATGTIAVNFTYILKQSASAFLTAFYAVETMKYKDAAKKTRAIADKLAGKGDCNPITDTVCYCAQPETMNDVQYCLPTIQKRQVAENTYQITCLDDQMRSDPQCNCLGTNTCYDKTINNMLDGLPSSYTKGALLPASSIYRGELRGAGVQGGSIQQAAMAKKMLADNNGKIPGVNDLSPDDEAAAKALNENMDIPLETARFFAAQKRDENANQFMSRFSGQYSNPNVAYNEGNSSGSNVLYFGGKKSRADQEKKSNLLDKLKIPKENPEEEGGSILKFAEKSQAGAQINKDKNAGLFEIISRRYKVSGLRRLGK
jgi:hypothetical protein